MVKRKSSGSYCLPSHVPSCGSYFKPGLPYLDRLVLKTMKDATTRMGAVRAGELAFATWIPLEMVRVLERVPGVQVVTSPMYNVWDLRMNVARPPFDDLRVRQAVAGYGIDRHEIRTLSFLGYGQPSVSMLTPNTRSRSWRRRSRASQRDLARCCSAAWRARSSSTARCWPHSTLSGSR